MKRLAFLLLLMVTTTVSYAQRGSKGQHTAAMTYGCNLTSAYGWSMILAYNNYRQSGTLDADFIYSYSKGAYEDIKVPVNNYMLYGGYSHRILENYKRTFTLFVGANAGIGYTQCNGGERELVSGVDLKTVEEISYALSPVVKVDCFVTKLFGFTFRVQDMIFIKSDLLKPHNLTLSLGFKYLIQ